MGQSTEVIEEKELADIMFLTNSGRAIFRSGK
jgi:hypothetical protein